MTFYLAPHSTFLSLTGRWRYYPGTDMMTVEINKRTWRAHMDGGPEIETCWVTEKDVGFVEQFENTCESQARGVYCE